MRKQLFSTLAFTFEASSTASGKNHAKNRMEGDVANA